MTQMTARVRLVRTQDGQRLDIPTAFTLKGDEAIIRSEGDRLVVEPVSGPETATSLLAILKTFETLDDDWPDIEDPPPEDVRL